MMIMAHTANDREKIPVDDDAATVSDATASSATTSGSQSKNSRSYPKLFLCCILPSSCPDTKFHPHQTKNIEVKMIRD